MTRPWSILEDRGRDADGNALAGGIDDVHHLVDDRPAGGEGLFEGAGAFADRGAEHVAAAPPQGLLAPDPGDLFGGAVEGRDAPFGVHGKDAVGHRVEQLIRNRFRHRQTALACARSLAFRPSSAMPIAMKPPPHPGGQQAGSICRLQAVDEIGDHHIVSRAPWPGLTRL